MLLASKKDDHDNSKKLLLAFTEQLGFIKTICSSTYRKDDHNEEDKGGGN